MSSFAIIKTGGKQYRVTENKIIRVEKLDNKAGENVSLDEVLMIQNGSQIIIGSPIVLGASVTATVIEQMRDRKIIVFKKKRRKNYRRKMGHRQNLTVLKITKIASNV